MPEWILIVSIFGEVVLETGPWSAVQCEARKAETIVLIDRRAATGVPVQFDGRNVTRADVEVDCVPATKA
jgi:hypothetical protein